MARRKNAPESIRIKHGLSERLRLLRTEFYGERGGPDLARTLEIPVRTWYNYENGVTVPAEIILRIVELTSVEVVWLLRGEGPKFRGNTSATPTNRLPGLSEGLATTSVTELLRAALERLEQEEKSAADYSFGPPIMTRSQESHQAASSGSLLEDSTPLDNESTACRTDGLRSEAELLESRRPYRLLRAVDDSMAPIVAEGAQVAYAEAEPLSVSFHEKLVVTWIEGQAMVRWFQHCGRFALLRAENPTATPPTILVDLDLPSNSGSFHRVLWISTPH